MVSKAMVYIGIAVGVIGMGAAIAYGTINQQSYVPEDAEFAPAAQVSRQSSRLFRLRSIRRIGLPYKTCSGC